ncbi:MAG TPA: GNAT family N-acetyltransferase [Myxococcales bacterium]|nr:GNAT family N-acetyltransferase [Myxococcales bacterium]
MVVIRKALASDVPQIRALIGELAAYERAPELAVATEEGLLRDGFGPQPRYFCLMAEVDGAVAGFALWFHNYSTWRGQWGLYLEDLFVRPAFRGRGAGKALFVELARIAVSSGCGRFDWQVLDWNRPSIEFYERLGAVGKKEWLSMRLEGEALERMARNG